MTRKLLLSFALFVFALGLAAQTTVITVITASNTKGSDGNKVAAGTITFRAVDLSGNPFFGNQSGLVIPRAVVCLIVNGAITTAQSGGACTLVDTAATNPTHFCYAATVYDSVSRWTAPAVPCIQPTGASWSLDSYIPSGGPTALVVAGAQGATGPAGAGYIAGLASDGSSGIEVAGSVQAGTSCPTGMAAGTVCGSNIFDVTTYGAVGDEQNNNTGSIAVGSNNLTTTGFPIFLWSDVGKTIVLPDDSTPYTPVGGGAAVNLTSGMETTITGYIGPNSVTIAAPAAVACTGSCPVGWGTNNTAAINRAFSALNASPNGGVLSFPRGQYLVDEFKWILKGVDFALEGHGATLWSSQPKTYNVQTVLVEGNTGTHGLYLHDFTLDFVVPLNTSNGTDFANAHTYTEYGDAIRIGDNCNAPTAPGWCAAAYGPINDVNVDHVKVYNARMTGIAVNYADGVILTNNTVKHVGQGITSANSVGSNIICGNIAQDSSDDLIGVYNNEALMNPTAQTSKATICHNILSQGFAKAIGVGGISHVVISDNSTAQTWAAGILVEDQAVFNETPSTDVSIVNNSIDSAGTYYGAGQFHTTAATDGGSGIYFYGAPSTLNNMKVEGNVITGYYFHGIEMAVGPGMGVTNATIANNYINATPTCPVCVTSNIQSVGSGIVVGDATNTAMTSMPGLNMHDNWSFNAAQSGFQINSVGGGQVKNNWAIGYGTNPGGQQTKGISINYSSSLVLDGNNVINSNGGTYTYALFHTQTALTQSRNLWSTGVGQLWTDFSAIIPTQSTNQQVEAQPIAGGTLGFLLDRYDALGSGLAMYTPTSNQANIMAATGTGPYLIVTSGWTASSGTVTFTETSGPTLAAGTLIAPNGLAGCSTATGLSALNNGYYPVLSGATSTSFSISTTAVTGSGSGTCNFTIEAPAIRVATGYGGGVIPGYIRLAPVWTDLTAPTHPIEFLSPTWYMDALGNLHTNSIAVNCTSGSGYLKSDGSCATPAAGLADPGGSGIIKRTALNTTAPAAAADVVALFASGSCAGYLRSDGTCANITTGGSPILGQVIVSGSTTNSVTISGINQSYTSLKIVIYGATSDSSANAAINCEYNGDTTAADYVGQYMQGSVSTVTTAAMTGSSTGGECGVLAGSSANASYTATSSTVEIPSYSSTAFTTKSINLTTSYPGATTLIIQTATVSWKQSTGTAITSIKFTDASGGNFKPGTAFTVYGEP